METACQTPAPAGARQAAPSPITHLRTSLDLAWRSNLVKFLSAFAIIIACSILTGFVVGMPTGAPSVSYYHGNALKDADISRLPSRPVPRATESHQVEQESSQATHGQSHREKSVSVGRTLGGFESGDEAGDYASLATASADGSGSTFTACICTGLLGLIGHRLKRRCR